MHDPQQFRPTAKLGLVTEEPNVSSRRDTPIRPPPHGATEESASTTPGDDRREYDESMQRALLEIPANKTPAEYARWAAVHSYRSAEASAAAFEMSGKAFAAAGEASKEAKSTRVFLQQLMDDNPTIAARVKRSMSGTMKSVTIPVSLPPPAPPLPPIEMPRNASLTGSSYTIPLTKLAELEEQLRERDAKQRERDAEERGKRELLVAQAAALATEQAESKVTRDKWLFILAIAATIGSIITYAIGHFSVH